MRTSVEDKNYDTMLEPSDWRFSAAIVGLMQYFDFFNIQYDINDEFILYNQSEISEERYLQFIEWKYGELLHHKEVENILKKSEFSEEDIKSINEKIKINAVMKKVFNKIKFDGTNANVLMKLIDENRMELIKETYGKMQSGLGNYIHIDNKKTVQILKEPGQCCRLVGYYIDSGKKGKSIGYNFNSNNFLTQDIQEFDFIPFAFCGDRETFFINDNFTINRLKISNKLMERYVQSIDEKVKNTRQSFFKAMIESGDFINHDVEVILKNRDNDYFETMYIRKKNIDILKSLDKKVDYKAFNFSFKITDKYYRNIQKEVINNILNDVSLDELIELFLKEKREYIVSQLIKTNILMKGEKNMKDRLKGAYACAKKVAESIEINKIDSYRQKLTSSVIFKDYDRACQILLQLSNYSNVEFGFVYDLFDNFEENKDLVYTFINALSKEKKDN